jgi:hypothetical protein
MTDGSKSDLEKVLAAMAAAKRPKAAPKPRNFHIHTKLAMGGRRELSRTADQAEFTKKWPPADYPNKVNPFLRENFYTTEELERFAAFEKWHRENPTRDHSENPYHYRPIAS